MVTTCFGASGDNNVVKQMSRLSGFAGKYVYGSSGFTTVTSGKHSKTMHLDVSLTSLQDWNAGTHFRLYKNGARQVANKKFTIALSSSGKPVRILTNRSDIGLHRKIRSNKALD